MQTILAKNIGFCGGVRRAFEMVEREFCQALKSKKVKKLKDVYILGSLVHNKNVADLIENWGIEKIDSLEELKAGDRVIITAHGAGQPVMTAIKKRGAKVFDTTCPKVKQIHQLVEKHSKKGDQVLIFGDLKHKEVQGICGWAQGKGGFKVLEKISDLIELEKEWLAKIKSNKNETKKAILVSQTTQNKAKFEKFAEKLEEIAAKLKIQLTVFPTICAATASRQPEAKELAKQAEAVVIIGGKDSSNTRRLFEIAKQENPNTIWIETLNSKTKQKLKEKLALKESVALISGASTPWWQIQAVERFLVEL
jgi:4-hydroxy-3-methylbut-2-enyl diphosphate reductase